MANAFATTSTDTITQGSGPDTLTVSDTSQINFDDSFDGGAGIDTIVSGSPGAFVATTVDLRLGTVPPFGFRNYEGLAFTNTAGDTNVILNASQFGTGLISTHLAVRGVNGTGQGIIIMVGSSFSAAKFTFTNWNGIDAIALNGSSSANVITGSSKKDFIDGNNGSDTLIGGPGKDFLTGDESNDTFKFNRTTESHGSQRDVISDFSHIEGDKIDVHGIDANTQAGGNQNFHFIGKQAFHHRAGELHFVKHGSFVTVEGDVNGDGKADFQIEAHNTTNDLISLVRGDFIL
jgi:Ca2+-binding RTX toxin-like protein